MRLPASLNGREIEQLLMVQNNRRDGWWVHRIEERHGARAWLGRKNFTSEDHSVPHRNRIGKRGTRGVRKSMQNERTIPLDTADFVRDVLPMPASKRIVAQLV